MDGLKNKKKRLRTKVKNERELTRVCLLEVENGFAFFISQDNRNCCTRKDDGVEEKELQEVRVKRS